MARPSGRAIPFPEARFLTVGRAGTMSDIGPGGLPFSKPQEPRLLYHIDGPTDG